jgi:hypothetical protein
LPFGLFPQVNGEPLKPMLGFLMNAIDFFFRHLLAPAWVDFAFKVTPAIPKLFFAEEMKRECGYVNP